jgi:signal transduction histidine kinase/ActR/RegA family two-component response regulator
MASFQIAYLNADATEAQAVGEELSRGGIEAQIRLIQNVADFCRDPQRPALDLILAARNGSGSDVLEACRVVRQEKSGTPVIVIVPELDSACVKDFFEAGADDVISRRHLTQIVPAVHRILRRDRESSDGRFLEEVLTGNALLEPSGRIIACNPPFARFFGFDSVAEAKAANFFSLLRSRKEGMEIFELARRNQSLERHELEMRQRDGETVCVVARFIGRFAPDGELTQLEAYLFNDTKRKRLEEQLVEAQKMESLGTLAGGIAHDFNNILAIILGYTTRLENWRADPTQMRSALTVIREAVERGAALVQQLLTSARQTEAHFAPVDLNSVVRDLEKMLSATFPKTIVFDLRLDPMLPSIEADRNQLYQVLLNLCVNARDAMPNGGQLTLGTRAPTPDEVREHFTDAHAERYVCLCISDTGHGMSPLVKAHIFEPFYTTKERGKGTGLGLSVVYGVVNGHRGRVRVESEPGSGSTFNIYLPTLAQPESEARAPGRRGQVILVPQTILLVEDEEMLRELGATTLEGEGYRVLTAKDGLEAMAVFEAHRNEIGLVICDLGLPRLSGRDVFMRMKEQRPNVRAIVASGYLEPNVRSEMLKAGVIDTIQKPYDFREMLEKIRSIMGETEADDPQQRLL